MGSSVYQVISKIQLRLAKIGLQKNQKNNVGRGFSYRGIDDIYNVVGPLLAKHGLIVAPVVTNREYVERKSNNGGLLTCVTVTVTYTLYDAETGDSLVTVVMGEAFDSGDKATVKALTGAYKTLLFQLLCIPTEGGSADPDADTYTLQQNEVTAAEIDAIYMGADADEVYANYMRLWNSYANDLKSQNKIFDDYNKTDRALGGKGNGTDTV